MLKLLPASRYDVPALQAWFSDQAKKGWLLDYWCGWCVFRRGEPAELQFRLEPAADGEYKPSEEKLEAYLDAGWEYVCKTSATQEEFFVWRSARPDPAELYTEPESESIRYQWLWKRYWRAGLWCCAPLPALPGLINALLTMQRGGTGWASLCWMLAAILLLTALCAARIYVDQRALRRLRNALRTGVPMPCRGRYGYLYPLQLALVLAFLLNLLLPFVLIAA
nr:DUF2812 domain-containing protein [uncultured Oscillibacter sp.]